MYILHFSLLEMFSTGILSRLNNKFEAKDSQEGMVPPVHIVSFEAVLPLLCVLAMGILLSMASLLAECGARRLLWKKLSS
jgi:hypothetical protein